MSAFRKRLPLVALVLAFAPIAGGAPQPTPSTPQQAKTAGKPSLIEAAATAPPK